MSFGIRKATVYLRRDSLLVQRVDITTDGGPIGVDDIVQLGAHASDAELGLAILGMVERARQGVPHPRQNEWAGLAEPLLRAAHVRSWRTFVRGCRDVSVFDDGRRLTFLPSENLGPREGFAPLMDLAVLALSREPSAVGQCAREALGRSIPWPADGEQ